MMRRTAQEAEQVMADRTPIITRPRLSMRTTLRILRRVLGDPDLSLAQRAVVMAVVMRADGRTGEAWAGYRSLHARYGLSPHSVRRTLAVTGGSLVAPVGRYLEMAGVGPRGAHRLRVTDAAIAAAAADDRRPDAMSSAAPGAALETPQRCAPARPALRAVRSSAAPRAARLISDHHPHGETIHHMVHGGGARRGHGDGGFHVAAGDLVSMDRLTELYAAAVTAGYLTGADGDMVRLVAAAVHAQRIAAQRGGDAVRLFAANVRNRRWGHPAQADEDAARRMIAEWEATWEAEPDHRHGPRPAETERARVAATIHRMAHELDRSVCAGIRREVAAMHGLADLPIDWHRHATYAAEVARRGEALLGDGAATAETGGDS